jgi:FKBP12-rapamycin complex-associated protein
MLHVIGETKDKEEGVTVLTTLAFLVSTVGRPARRFIVPIERLLASKGMNASIFKEMMDAAANGPQKVKLPASAKYDELLDAETTFIVVSSSQQVGRKDVEKELASTLHIAEKDFEVTETSRIRGQTIIRIRFKIKSLTQQVQTFLREANDPKSQFRQHLRIVSVEQQKQVKYSLNADFMKHISSYPSRSRYRGEQDWARWAQVLCQGMLNHSPFPAIHNLGTLAHNVEIAKNLFPFSASALIDSCDLQHRESIMNAFSNALLNAPYRVRLILLALAEFLESERSEKRPTVVRVTQTVDCVVTRDNLDMKFGINYDQEQRGIVVTKLAPDGPGERAGVPVGAVLQSINGQRVRTVSEIPTMIRGLLQLTLTFTRAVEERQAPPEKPLMDINILAKVAFDSQMHAKAIYFNEVLFDKLFRAPSQEGSQTVVTAEIKTVVKRLLEFYNHLGLGAEAKGLVKVVNQRSTGEFGFEEAGTLEQLNWWSDALKVYRSHMFQSDKGLHTPSLLGVLRCLESTGEIPATAALIEEHWGKVDAKTQLEIAPHRAQAAFALGQWDKFDDTMAEEKFAVLCDPVIRCAGMFRQRKFDELTQFIHEKRQDLFEKFQEEFGESYVRGFDTLVEEQHFVHFEELMCYKESTDERKSVFRALWKRRLGNMPPRPSEWVTVTSINSLVLSHEEDTASRVDLVRVCSKQSWFKQAEYVLKQLLQTDSLDKVTNIASQAPKLIAMFAKFIFNTNKHKAYDILNDVLGSASKTPDDPFADDWGRCWLLLGEWTMQLHPTASQSALNSLKRATELNPKDAQAFHNLGILHHDLTADTTRSPEERIAHGCSAVSSLFSAIRLTPVPGELR